MFLLGLILFGLCLALFFPAARALLSDIYHERRGRAFGVHAMGIDFAGILAAGIAILIVAVATWRAAFVPILLLMVPFAVLFPVLSRQNIKINSIDLQIRGTGKRIFSDSSIRWVLVVYCLFSIAQSGITSFLPTFLINVHDFSFAFASSSFAIIYGVGIFSKPIAGILSDRIPRKLVGGGNLFLAGLGVVMMILTSHTWIIIVGVGVFAFGQRGVAPPLQAYLMDLFSEDSMAGDLGAFRGFYMAAGSLGPVYTGFVSGVFGFIPAYTTLLALYLVGAAILLWPAVRARCL
jgi:predicted MFS family arabinose efflux permease